MPDPILDLPLDAIDADALPRDRSLLDPGALHDLTTSIAATGLRQPIEVWELSTPRDGHRYGLISGLRRLTAHRRLEVKTIPAFLRKPASIPDAMAAMIAENEVRADLSAWEKGRIIVEATDEGLFDTLDAAVKALHPLAAPATRSRIRTLASVVDVFQGRLNFPEAYSQRQMLRLATAVRADFLDLIETALTEHRPRTQIAEWALIEPIVEEAEGWLTQPRATYRIGRPRRAARIRPSLLIRRELTKDGWTLRFTGNEATGPLMEDIMDEVERLYGKG